MQREGLAPVRQMADFERRRPIRTIGEYDATITHMYDYALRTLSSESNGVPRSDQATEHAERYFQQRNEDFHKETYAVTALLQDNMLFESADRMLEAIDQLLSTGHTRQDVLEFIPEYIEQFHPSLAEEVQCILEPGLLPLLERDANA